MQRRSFDCELYLIRNLIFNNGEDIPTSSVNNLLSLICQFPIFQSSLAAITVTVSVLPEEGNESVVYNLVVSCGSQSWEVNTVVDDL